MTHAAASLMLWRAGLLTLAVGIGVVFHPRPGVWLVLGAAELLAAIAIGAL